ncbi:MAG TPA: glycoside hydrolase family 2 TIM barrel-domain containing protein, partial [Pirellulales bacterium]|nr:glycoside hydrolase family 2 TIM barrel-domain containing protein [Pirellulales bacterium]
MMRGLGVGGFVEAATLFILCVIVGGSAQGAGSPREVTSLDADWRFHRGDSATPGIGRPIAAWRWKEERRGEASAAEMAAADLKTDGADWKDAKPGDDVFHGRRGFCWFRTELPAAVADKPTLLFESVDDNAVVYLNGKRLIAHQGWNDPFSVPLAEAWRKDGPNVLAVLVENTAGAGRIGETTLEGLVDQTRPADSPINPSYDDSSWQRVDVPHDYIVEGTFSEQANKDHGFLPVEPGWYRKTIAIPATAKGRRLWLEFDGVYRNSRMWLNGKYLGNHPSGYGSFRYDVTDAALQGKDNLLTVRVDPRGFEGWWYEGGGIYRHVRLVSVEPVHIPPWGVFVSSTVKDVGDGVQADAAVTVATTLVNESGDTAKVTLRSEILDAEGKVVASAENPEQLPTDRKPETRHKLPVAKANLWSLGKPYLYSLRSTLSKDGKVADQVTTPFGIRTIRFDADKGFFLNGKPVKLKGTCNHQDFAGVGIAVPDSILEWRIQKLKEMGSNAYRCSHNPVAAELLDACDRLGMLVMDETRHLGDTYSGKSPPSTPYSNLSDLSEMVLRDRNHPSIIMWSICNEEGIQGSAAGAKIAKAMKDRVNSLDGTRPVSAAMNGGHGGSGLTTVLDLEGYNYSPRDYAGFHKKYPQKPMYGSETASAVSTRGIYANDKAKGYVSAYDVNAPPWALPAEKAWRPIAENDYMAGCFVWTGFDYRGEPTPYGWPCINSHFGIMDMCGFPKDSYYYYQAWWS